MTVKVSPKQAAQAASQTPRPAPSRADSNTDPFALHLQRAADQNASQVPSQKAQPARRDVRAQKAAAKSKRATRLDDAASNSSPPESPEATLEQASPEEEIVPVERVEAQLDPESQEADPQDAPPALDASLQQPVNVQPAPLLADQPTEIEGNTDTPSATPSAPSVATLPSPAPKPAPKPTPSHVMPVRDASLPESQQPGRESNEPSAPQTQADAGKPRLEQSPHPADVKRPLRPLSATHAPEKPQGGSHDPAPSAAPTPPEPFPVQTANVEPAPDAAARPAPRKEIVSEPSAHAAPTSSLPTPSQPAPSPDLRADSARTAQDPPPISHEKTFDQIVLGLRTKMDAANQKAHIELNPPNLGKLQVAVEVANGMLTAQFHASTDVVRDLLSSKMDQLRSVLEGQGITVDKLAVSTSSGASNVTPASSSTNSQHDGRSGGTFAQDRQPSRHSTGDTFARMWRAAQENQEPVDLLA